ncbi:hypothetical protein VNO77_26000 [Canavalia gladiata]|uniref:Uncharacterized protein n=1 Tax=Canavalia gladiata TaxID=3824 RepID=A0AAN9KUG3_CANGL
MWLPLFLYSRVSRIGMVDLEIKAMVFVMMIAVIRRSERDIAPLIIGSFVQILGGIATRCLNILVHFVHRIPKRLHIYTLIEVNQVNSSQPEDPHVLFGLSQALEWIGDLLCSNTEFHIRIKFLEIQTFTTRNSGSFTHGASRQFYLETASSKSE